jgi:hypothetical protein
MWIQEHQNNLNFTWKSETIFVDLQAKSCFKLSFEININRIPVNEQQQLVLNCMLEDGFKAHMNTKNIRQTGDVH